MTELALRLVDVSFKFGGHDVLKNINLEVPAGEVLLLCGPSGSGKTTLLSLAGALRSMQSGSMRVLGTELLGATRNKQERLREKLGYVFQHHNLLDFLTAEENVMLGLVGGTELRHKRVLAKAAMSAVGLSDRCNAFPHELSGGQKQRVAIARALVRAPALVLADEPTASLDSTTGHEIVRRLRSLAQDSGATVLLSTHDERLLTYADRVLCLENGMLVSSKRAPTSIARTGMLQANGAN